MLTKDKKKVTFEPQAFELLLGSSSISYPVVTVYAMANNVCENVFWTSLPLLLCPHFWHDIQINLVFCPEMFKFIS